MQIIWWFFMKSTIYIKKHCKSKHNFWRKWYLWQTDTRRLNIQWFQNIILDLRRFSDVSSSKTPVCFFCDNTASTEKGPLHLVQSFRLDQRVRRCANVLEDSYLHAKLQNGDIIAQDAMYHKVCLSNLYRSASYKQLEGNFSDYERKLQRITFGEVVAFIEESFMASTEQIPAFKLSDLMKLYVARLSAYSDNKEVFFVFNNDVWEAIAAAAEANYDDDSYILARPAHILRR